MWNDLDVFFDRVTYRDGQLLTARDLRDERRREARLRWLHTLYLHETWGIALGLGVYVFGRDRVIVRPGYAVDGLGREILLAEAAKLYLPDVADGGTFVLTMEYKEDGSYQDRSVQVAVCLGSSPGPHHEQPVFTWRQPEDVTFGPQVPLAQVELVHGRIRGGIDGRVRRYTRPLVRPYMARGATEPGRTGWLLWQSEMDFRRARILGLTVTVDTAQAGFTQVPYYFATLQGDFGERPGEAARYHPAPGSDRVEPAFFLDAFAVIANAASDRFTFGLLGSGIMPDAAEERKWTISWLGIEPRAGCDPDTPGA